MRGELQTLVQRLESWERSLSARETALAQTVEAEVCDGVVQALMEASEHRGQRLERERVLELISWLQRDFSTPTHTYNTLEILKKNVLSPTDHTPDRLP